MNIGYVLSTQCQIDLVDIAHYLQKHASKVVAEKVLKRIESRMASIASGSISGHRRTDLTDHQVRFSRIYSYLLVFVEGSSPVQFVRVLHASRDFPDLFDT